MESSKLNYTDFRAQNKISINPMNVLKLTLLFGIWYYAVFIISQYYFSTHA